jgi:hypothetical protein
METVEIRDFQRLPLAMVIDALFITLAVSPTDPELTRPVYTPGLPVPTSPYWHVVPFWGWTWEIQWSSNLETMHELPNV